MGAPLKKYYDIVFLGGGLANSLAAYRLKHTRPEIEFLLVEQDSVYGGNHTWSFHDDDLTPLEWSWVYPLVSATWPATEVRFPAFTRVLSSRYHAVRSERLNEILQSELTYQKALNLRPTDVSPTQVTLENGFSIQAGCVIDGRGWKETSAMVVGYQKFFGIELKLKRPHKLAHPILMDAQVPQTDGYRFFYVLPWAEKHVLIEDTYYSDTPALNVKQERREIHDYAERLKWEIASTLREEHGALPIPLEGEPDGWNDGIPLSGTRAGLFHATTGYSFPDAVHFADRLAHLRTLNAKTVYSWAKDIALDHWKKQRFFRFLNRMMFRAAPPQDRFRVLEHFYRGTEDMISRFYAGHLTWTDQLRLLSGRPPVPLSKAVKCLLKRRNNK